MITARRIACVVAMLGANAVVSAQDACQRDLLLASDGDGGDKYGIWIGIDGDLAVVGAYANDAGAIESGAVYLLQNIGGSWIEQTKLFADDGGEVDWFGWSAAIDGDTVVVGAPNDDDMGGNAGAAYVFQFDGGNWVQQQKLLADDGAAPDLFGYSVALEGDTLVVGAENKDSETGAVYIFTRSRGTWSQRQKLTASDGEILDAFGYSVVLQDDQIVVGAIGDDDVGDTAGAVYVFTRSDDIWTQQAKITAPGGATSDNFGISVALDGGTFAVGTPGDDQMAPTAGAVYVFTGSDGDWGLQQKVVALDGVSNAQFGTSVCLIEDTLVVGAWNDTTHESATGSAYAYTRIKSFWLEVDKLTANDGEQSDNMGRGIAMSGDTVLVGAINNDDNGNNSGSVYEFSITCALGDLDGDGVVGASDLIILLGAWGPCDDCDDCPPDLDEDCTVGTGDLLLLLGNWG